MITKRTKLLALGSALAFILAGCASDSDVVLNNLHHYPINKQSVI